MPKRKTAPQTSQRSTRQREAILTVIRAAPGPLTVNEIHEQAAEVSEGLGIATVYRTIKRLVDGHDIHAVVLPDGQTRYEPGDDSKHHDHFRCRSCDKVYDLNVCPLSIPAGTVFPGGFVVEDHELTIYGTCPDCRAGSR